MNKKQKQILLSLSLLGPALFVNSHIHHNHVHNHHDNDREVELQVHHGHKKSHNHTKKESLLLRTLRLLLKNKKSSSRILSQYPEMDEHKHCGTDDVDDTRKHTMQKIYDEWVERYQSIINSEGEGGEDSLEALTFSYQFDVYFHIIHDGNEGYLSDAVVEAAIANLNSGFAGNEYATCVDDSSFDDDDYTPSCAMAALVGIPDKENIFRRNGKNEKEEEATRRSRSRRAQLDSTVPGNGINTGISFVLKEITRTDNAAWFRGMEDLEVSYKQALHQGDCRTLNVYTGDSAYLGWTHYPDVCSQQKELDGVVIDYSSVPGGTNPTFNEGDSLTHEVGHWLGLFHTFEGGCDGSGDFVGDTAPQKSFTIGCPARQDTCSGEGFDPIHNFMDYSDDCCMDSFTPNQKDRMVSMIQYYRT